MKKGLSLMAVLFLSVALLSVVLAGPALAQSPRGSRMELVGQLGGGSRTVFVAGNYAYIGEGARLTILNVSNSFSPTLEGQSDYLYGFVQDVFVHNDVAYVAVGGGGLEVIDVNDPASPVYLGTYEVDGWATAVYVSDTVVYVGSTWGGSGVTIFDASDPGNLSQLTYFATVNDASGVYVSGHTLYIANGATGLQIYDVTDPANPAYQSLYSPLGNTAYDVQVVDNTAYIYFEGALEIADVTDPTDPSYLSTVSIAQGMQKLHVFNKMVYLTYGNFVEIIDANNPASPTNPGQAMVFQGTAGDVYVTDTLAYIANENGGGLQITNIDSPSTPSYNGAYLPPVGPVEGLHLEWPKVYAAGKSRGFYVISIDDPANPYVYGSDPTAASQSDVYAEPGSDIAYGGSGPILWRIDVTEWMTPVATTYVPTNPTALMMESLYVSDTILYVANYDNLQLLDISDPFTPTLLGAHNVSGGAVRDVVVVDNLAYLADGQGLRIINVADPNNLNQAGFIPTAVVPSRGVDVAGDYAYVANDSDGLHVIDISDPANPVEVSSRSTSGLAWDVDVTGNLAYVYDARVGLRVFDISDPANPIERGYYWPISGGIGRPGDRVEVIADGNIAYVATGAGGLYILRYVAGTATFKESLTLDSSYNTRDVELGDLNRDGFLDVVVANASPNEVWLNDGKGSFITTTQPLGSEDSQALALGDLDDDGDLDALIGNGTGQPNQIWLNNGSGLFTGQITVPLGVSNTTALALGDLDDDGDLDAFVGNGSGQAAQIWLNGGGGSIFTATHQALASADTTAVALGDLDDDGQLDAVIGNGGGQADRTWFNDGSGSFTPGGSFGASDTAAVALADLDGDHIPDAVTVGAGSRVWLNNGSGGLALGQTLSLSDSRAVALGDLDNDGHNDIVIGSAQANQVWLNDGSGNFNRVEQDFGSSDTNAISLGDLDGDGDLDIFEGNGLPAAGAANVVWWNDSGLVSLYLPTILK